MCDLESICYYKFCDTMSLLLFFSLVVIPLATANPLDSLTLGGTGIKEIHPESVRPPVENDKLTSGIGLHGWSDGSWKAKANYAGYLVMAFNGPIEWGSKIIKVTMHSSSEIEIAAACLCAKRIMFLREMSNEVGWKVKTPIPLLIDNSGAIEICVRKWG